MVQGKHPAINTKECREYEKSAENTKRVPGIRKECREYEKSAGNTKRTLRIQYCEMR